MSLSITDTLILELPHRTPAGTEVVSLSLKPPSTVSLASSLNRLLRCTHPAYRQREVFTRWLNQHWSAPPPEKKFLETLSITTLATLTYQWLVQALGHSPQWEAVNQSLHQHFFDEDRQTTDLNAWVKADLTLLQAHRHPNHHPEHYHWPEEPTDHTQQLICQVLHDHGYDVTLFQQASLKTLGEAYLNIRYAHHPFPWATCFQALLSQTHSSQSTQWQTHYPHLRHGLDVYYQHTQQSNALVQNPTPLMAVRPVRHWVFVEGITETTLLPAWARQLGLDLYKTGVAFIETGGKKPMLHKLQELKTYFSGPVTLILDQDAQPDRPEFEALLNLEQDDLVFIDAGTVEDAYSDDLLLQVLNTHYYPVVTITAKDLTQIRQALSDSGKVPNNIRVLKTLFNDYELESNAAKPTQGFDKVAFAQSVLRITDVHPHLIPSHLANTLCRRFQ